MVSAASKEEVSIRVLSGWQQAFLALLVALVFLSVIGIVVCVIILAAVHTLSESDQTHAHLVLFASVLIGLSSAALVGSIGTKKRVSLLFPSDQLFCEYVDDRISPEAQPTVARPSDQLIHLTEEGIYVRLSLNFFFRRWHWFVPWRSVSSCKYSDEGGYIEPVVRRHTMLKMTPNQSFPQLKTIVMTHIGAAPKEEARIFCSKCGAANPDERESCASCGGPLQIQKRRHGFVTVWLVLSIIGYSLWAALYMWYSVVAENLASWASLGVGRYIGTPWWVFLILCISAAFGARCTAALLDWEKWGFYGIAAAALVSDVVNSILGSGLSLIILIILIIAPWIDLAILFGILHIGRQRKVWPQLE